MEPGLWGALIRIVVCLPIVILLIYLSIKYGLSRAYSMRKGHLEILEQISLAPRATLNIVRVGSEYLLLSATENEIVLVKSLEGYQEAEKVDFRYHLTDVMQRWGKGSNQNGK